MKRFLVCSIVAVAVLSLGLVLIHCGGGGDDKQCETNDDCPTGYWCDRTVWECKVIDCIPDCTGICCGDDGCNGTCTDNCPTGYECNATSCICESTGCNSDSDCTTDQCCLQGECTDVSCGNGTWTCGNDSVCTLKSCGTCGAGTHCDNHICVADQACTGDGDCNANECCLGTPGVCTPEDCTGRVCGPDTECGNSCGTCPAGQTCNLSGQCETAPFEGECPTGQQCTDLTSDSSGYYGCVEPPMTVPAGNQTGCDPWEAGIYCDGNYTCVPSTPENVCIENCGNCAAGLECVDMVDGYRGCMTTDGDIPVDAPICGSGNPCVGNATCWIFTYGDGTQRYACIANCNLGYGCTTENETRCVGDTVQTCTGGTWVETTDCTASSQFCDSNTGACIAPPGEGDFCDNTGYQCAAGLECVGFQGYDNAFCTPTCDCTNNTGCSAGWECLIPDADPPTQCWCLPMCPGQSVSECPNGGTGWTCEVVGNDGTNDIYGCMP